MTCDNYVKLTINLRDLVRTDISIKSEEITISGYFIGDEKRYYKEGINYLIKVD